MATSTIPNPNAVRETLTVELANSVAMSVIGGLAYGYRVGNQMICYVSLGFKATQQRAADVGVFRLRIDGKKIIPDAPYFIPCMVNSDGVMRFCYRDGTDGWWQNPITWNANAEFRISGVYTGTISS